MSFALDYDQKSLADGVGDLLKAKSSGDYARAVAEGRDDWRKLWSSIAELGVPGMAIPEKLGGLGLGPVELVAVSEQIGRFLAPGPVVATAGAFVPTALAAGDMAAATLSRIASAGGSATLVLDDHRSEGSMKLSGDSLKIRNVPVPEARRTDVFGFVLKAEEGLVFAIIDAEGLKVEDVDGYDRTRPLSLVSADARAHTVSLPGGAASLSLAFATAAAELNGMSAEMLKRSVQYAGERKQFGREIGSFQAVKHRLAEALLLLERARSLTYRAAVLCADPEITGDEELLAARLAKAAASEAATEIGRSAVQVHGGIGVTTELDIGIFYLRSRQASMQLGDRDRHYLELSAQTGFADLGATG